MVSRPAPRPMVRVLAIVTLVCTFISLITGFIALLSGRPGSSRAVANFDGFMLRYHFEDFTGAVENYLTQELNAIEGDNSFGVETVGLSRSFSYDWHMYYLGACRSNGNSKYLCHSRNPEEEVSVFQLALDWENDNSSLAESETTFPSRYLDVEVIPANTLGAEGSDETEDTEDTELPESHDASEQDNEGEGNHEGEQNDKAKRQEENSLPPEVSQRARELTDQINEDLDAWASQDLRSTRGPFIALCIAIACVFFQPVVLIYLAAKPHRISKKILAPLSLLVIVTAVSYMFTAAVITSRIADRVGDHDPFGGRVPGALIQVTPSPSFLAVTWIPAVMCLLSFVLIVTLDTLWTRDQRAIKRSNESEKEKDRLLVPEA